MPQGTPTKKVRLVQESQRKKNQKKAEGQSGSSPAPGDTLRKRKTKNNQKDPASNSDIEGRITDLEYQINGMQSNIMDSIVSQMCRNFEELKSMIESTVLTLRQQADINTAAMVARGVDTTTNPETFTETPESGLENS